MTDALSTLALPRVALMWLVLMCAASGPHALSIRGTLADAQEQPVSDAAVWLRTETAIHTVQSGADGSFRFDQVPAGACEVVAYRDGLAIGGAGGFFIADADIHITLEETQELVFRVINQDLFPVPGSYIKSMLVREQFHVPVEHLAAHGLPRLRADDSGIITVPFMPKNTFAQLLVSHYRYADTNVAYLPVGGKRQDIILQSGARLGGRVMQGEAPVAGARVTALIAGSGGRQIASETVSDPEGFYAVYLPDGEYHLVAHHPEYASPNPHSMVVSRDKEENTLNLSLLLPHRIEGRILMDGDSPAPGVWLEFGAQDQPLTSVHTDASGRFVILAPAPQGVLRILPPPGYMSEDLPDIPVNMGEARQARLDAIHLIPLPIIAGTFSMPDGAPAAHVLIASTSLLHPIWALSDAEGRFQIQLPYKPDTDKIGFAAEHPAEFLRREFTVDLKRNRGLRLRLAEYTPGPFPDPAPEADAIALLNHSAPELECAQWFNTDPLTIAELKGRCVLALFWGGFDDSPAGINRIEEIRAIHAALGDTEAVVFLGIHDDAADAEQAGNFVRRLGIEFPVGLDAEPSKTFSKYGIRSIPQILLIDKEGVVRHVAAQDRLLERIKTLMVP